MLTCIIFAILIKRSYSTFNCPSAQIIANRDFKHFPILNLFFCQEGIMDFCIDLPCFKTKNPIFNKINHYVLANLSSPITLKDMSQVSGVSTFYLCRLFKKELKITPIKWLWTQRVMAAAAYLSRKHQFSLTDVAFSCGFTSSAHFSRLFKMTYGMKPSEYRHQVKSPYLLEKDLIPKFLENSSNQFSMVQFSLFSRPSQENLRNLN